MNPSKSVLLVEDDKDDQYFFIEALRGIENVTLYDVANNGIEALDRLDKPVTLPDFIFMDINMPKMDGIECLSRIKSKLNIKNIPVVILSTDTGKTELAYSLGATTFIKKPSDATSLRIKLEQVINFDFTNITHANFQISP